MRIAVLALQGAFAEHEQMLERIGVDYFEVRQAADWQQPKDGLILPGGESTTMMKLLHDLGLYHDIQQAIQEGSFHIVAPFIGIPDEVPMTFIRAPYIQETGDEVEVLAVVDGHIVAARQGNQLVTAFHPELDEDPRLHQYFISMVQT